MFAFITSADGGGGGGGGEGQRGNNLFIDLKSLPEKGLLKNCPFSLYLSPL